MTLFAGPFASAKPFAILFANHVRKVRTCRPAMIPNPDHGAAGGGLVVGLVLMALMTLGACSPTGALVGVGAGAGIAASEERGFRGAVSDATIRGEINFRWLEYSPEVQLRLGLSIYEGRVLVTGVVEQEEQRNRVIELAWQPNGVREVINEVIVDPSGERGNLVRDTWISTQLRSNLLFDRDVSSINYSVDTVRGTVYVIGIAQNREELDRVIEHARNVGYVERVVNHAILIDDPRRPARALERLEQRRAETETPASPPTNEAAP